MLFCWTISAASFDIGANVHIVISSHIIPMGNAHAHCVFTCGNSTQSHTITANKSIFKINSFMPVTIETLRTTEHNAALGQTQHR